ncbi:MAG TPA: hypothetical protein VI814_12545 [Candidatus Limnocylindria bacterium]
MRLRLLGAFLALALLATGGSWYATANADSSAHNGASAISNQAAFRAAMRKLWEDHIVWTRMVIVDVIAGTPDSDAALARLLRNQTDIGDAIKPYFGDAAGTQLTGLLRQHILIAGQLLTAAKAGDTNAFASAKAAWYANAHDIAVFLAAANDKWSLALLDDEMKMHLDQTLAEAVARFGSDWTGDVAAYDAVHVHILHMADTLSDGIIAKFPAAFAH